MSFAFLLIACTTTIKTTTHPRLGAGTRPPTDPAQVEVLHRPPMRAFVRLGKVRATPQGSADEQAIETALRKAAAGMGANAIIMGPGGDGESGAVVEATAIAYR